MDETLRDDIISRSVFCPFKIIRIKTEAAQVVVEVRRGVGPSRRPSGNEWTFHVRLERPPCSFLEI